MTAARSVTLPRVRIPSLSGRRAVAVLLWLMIGVEALFVVGLVASAGETNPIVNVWLSLATQWVPVTIFWLMAARTGFKRAEIILAAAAITLSALGDTYYSLAMDSTGYLPFPSPAEAGYLLFYPLMVAAIVVLVRRQTGRTPAIIVVESAVAALGAAAVLSVILDPVIRSAVKGDTAFDSSIALAYPLFDILLLAVMIGISASPSIDVGRRWWALIAGLGIFAAADIIYALLENRSAYQTGTPLDATWAVGLGFVTWWVAGTVDSPATTYARKPLGLPVPAVAVLAGLAVLVIGTQTHLSPLAIVLGAATVGLAAVPIIFRQAVVGRLLSDQEKVVRQLTELDRDKSDMMVTMNHEFRTPLTSINGYVELLLDGDGGELPAESVPMLRVIESSAARLQDLVDELLTMSKLETGTGAVERRPVYVAGLLGRAADPVRKAAKEQGIELTTECDNFALMVDADGRQLERAFAGLVENAVKFSRAGGSVSVVAENDSHTITVRVTDTGIGIPENDLPRLFTRFFRAANVQKSAIPGAGLGLAITRSVVEKHGGSVGVQSVLGKGTTMTVTLPVSTSDRMVPQR